MTQPQSSTTWTTKFTVAFSGAAWAIRTQSSFWFHIPIAIAVIVVAAILQVETWRWAVLLLATGLVFSLELANSAIEQLVSVLHPEHDPQVGRALDVAASAVFGCRHDCGCSRLPDFGTTPLALLHVVTREVKPRAL